MNDSITLEELLDLIIKRIKPPRQSSGSAYRMPAITGTRPSDVRVLVIDGLERYVGLSCSSIYELIALDDFPKAIPLAQRRVGWLIEEVDRWIENRREQRDKQNAALPE